MIKVIIKNNGITGWVELPLKTSALNAIKSEQFLNKQEMIKFASHELQLNHKRAWRYICECSETEIYGEKLNDNIDFITRWVCDSFGLLLQQNNNGNAKNIMRRIWYKVHSIPLPSQALTSSKVLEL